MKLLKIGRSASNNIILNSNMVSSIHAELTILDNGDIILEDKNSHNGTFVMNKPIQPGMSVPIRRGDAVRFADVELQWSQVPIPEDNSQFKAIYGIGTNFRNEIQLNGATVSRFHATLKIGRNGKSYIIDHSKNGTTINGIKIKSDTPVQIKHKDSIVCGGVPVDIKPYIKASHAPKILSAVAAAMIIVCLVFAGKKMFRPDVNPIELTPATVYVHGAFYIVASFDDDPFQNPKFTAIFKQLGVTWPKEYIFGTPAQSGDQYVWQFGLSESKIDAIHYSGTAFFINRDGMMATNRHIAVPWEYVNSFFGQDAESAIKEKMEEFRTSQIPVSQIITISDLAALSGTELGRIICLLYQNGYCTLDEIRSYINTFKSSKITISGRHQYVRIGYPGRNYNSEDELPRCTVVKESDDPKIDVAIMQLNDHKTPDEIKMIYDIENARTDVSTLKPQQEDLFTIGYPAGLTIGLDNQDGGLKATVHKISISKEPGDYSFQFQGEELGGASGSPIIDKKGRLVGVLWGGFKLGSSFGEACEVKYLKKLYDDAQSKKSSN